MGDDNPNMIPRRPDGTLYGDDYDSQESLVDQVGAGAVLDFAFTSLVSLVIVTSQGLALVARATATTADVPTASKGALCFHEAATYLPVRTSAVKVFAPVGTTISVVGLRRA